MKNQPVIEGTRSCIYKYGIKFSRNNWIDMSSFTSLKKRKRTFSIYRWVSNATQKFGNGPPTVVSGWSLWLTFRDRKWEKCDDKLDMSFGWMGAPLIPMHMFFATGEEFKEWLGEDAVEKLFSELL